MKKSWFSALILLLVMVLVVFEGLNSLVGRVEGPEYDRLILGGVVYERTDQQHGSVGLFTGVAFQRRRLFRVYTVQNDPEGLYRVARQGWEGYAYRRMEPQP